MSQHNSIRSSPFNEALLADIKNNKQLSSDSLHLIQDQYMDHIPNNCHESSSIHEDPFIKRNDEQSSILEQVSI